jgi:hypothetical protein
MLYVSLKMESQTYKSNEPSLRVGVVKWSRGLGDAIVESLKQLGYLASYFNMPNDNLDEFDIVLTFGPYGDLLPVLLSLKQIPEAKRPWHVHWSTQGMPDLRIPQTLMKTISKTRASLGRHLRPGSIPPLNLLNYSLIRFKYVGDYLFGYREGLTKSFSDTSAIYSQLYCQLGLPASAVPYGASPSWGEDLKLERDIDVLWMGKMGSSRRRKLIDDLYDQLTRRGLVMLVADDVRHPFVFGQERINLLNRAKISLNLTRTWYDDNSLRFVLVAPNRSLIVSESILPHAPHWEIGVHYVSSPVSSLFETILFYLEHDSLRREIADNAYKLVKEKLTMDNSVRKLLSSILHEHVPLDRR